MVRYADGNNLAAMARGNNRRANSAPLGNSSVSEGRVRIASEEGLLVEGSQVVSGLLKILGTLNLSGTFILSGDTDASGAWRQSGAFTLTGPFTVEGNTSMTGNLTATGEVTLTGPVNINGPTGLNGTMTVHSSGKIIIEGPTPLEIANGAITAGGASLQFVAGLGMEMSFGTSKISVGPFGVSITAGSNTGITVSPLGIVTINGKVFMPDLPDKP